MNPIYKFELTVNGVAQRAFPVYGNNLEIEFEQASNERFFRRKLSGKLTFQKTDYVRITTAAFDTEFGLRIYISYDAGTTWTSYWVGAFWKTDCEFDADSETVTVQPNTKDDYDVVLAGLDKEYDIIPLAPKIAPIKLDKRPMIQVYVPGQTVIGCFLSGMWWEQECEAITSESNLINTYRFLKNKTLRVVDISGNMSPQLPDVMTAENVNGTLWEISGGGYTLRYAEDTSDPDYNFTYYEIVRDSDNVRLWYKQRSSYETPPQNVVLNPVTGSGATGDVTIYIHDMSVFARYVTDVESAGSVNTYPIPDNDIVPNNRNYSRVTGYNFPNTIAFSDNFSQTPTQWGLYEPGIYYETPSTLYGTEWFPVARSAWGRISIWFSFAPFDWIVEERWRKEYTLRDAYPLSSVISVLLSQVAPGITHEATTEYSQFLYGVNPISNIQQELFITPKSNLISSGYDQPAQKALVTLGEIMQMLRTCFRCYWYIEDGKFKIEHVRFFDNGGTYFGTPGIGVDLTRREVTRNGKKWAFATSKYSFEKPDMAARYQFEWMDDVTQLFEGYPIDIVSGYVNQENIENVSVAKFTSDVDYILLNPTEISKDGFVLLAPVLTDGEYKLPYLTFGDVANPKILQNAYVAFAFLQRYYFWDMPAWDYKINGTQYRAYGIKKLKTQTLKFPCLQDPNILELIKTNLGSGTIKKLSVNLSSRSAEVTLNYDTE